MFSSTDGISPFSQVSPYMNWYLATSSSPSSSICLYENPSSTISQHEDLLAYYLSTQAPPVIDSTKNSPNTSTPRCRPRRQKSTRKERHSKIFTAQGPRDRRVRLSIDISKKFFGLQDLLGFDKASLTLDWLLSSSKTAIEELLRAKKIDSYDKAMCQLYSSSEAEDDEPRQKNANNSARKRKRKRKSSTAQKHHNTDAFLIEKIAKETRRAQARARARERTRVKICLRSLLICSQQHKLPDLFNSPRNPTSGKSSSPPVEAGFIFVNPQTGEVNARENVKTRPHFYNHML